MVGRGAEKNHHIQGPKEARDVLFTAPEVFCEKSIKTPSDLITAPSQLTRNIQSLLTDRIIRAVDHPLKNLWEDISSSSGPGHAVRNKSRRGRIFPSPGKFKLLDTFHDDLTRMGDPKTLGTIRALAADGVFSKSLK
jgi:hypothetical protein